MFVLAHLSDPHLPLPEVSAGALISKRLTGYLSWRLKRRHIHVPQALHAVVDDILGQAPDHIALTGDIANISLPAEFDLAADWLRQLARPDRLTVVPGNHDRYVAVAWAPTLGQWAPYMRGDDATTASSPADFPFLRRRGEVALIGLSTALPTLPFLARGELGDAQINRLDSMLERLGREQLCRVVLIHHPPHPGRGGWRKGLTDGEKLRQVLRRRGADLVLHGHNHRNEINRIEGPNGAIPVLGVISASMAPDSRYGRGGWNAIRIRREAGAWRFTVEHRCLDDTGRSCRQHALFELPGPEPRPRAAASNVSSSTVEPIDPQGGIG